MYLMLQVILRAREAEMQFLRQEARSLKEELKIARMVLRYLILDYIALARLPDCTALHLQKILCIHT